MTSAYIFSYLPFLLLLHHHPTTTAATPDLVDETCKSLSKNNPNINYTFCINAFHSTPSSHGVNRTRLGLISINLAKKNATATSSTINRLLEDNTTVDKATRRALDDCSELYSDSISTLSEAARDYRAKRFDDANVKISSVMDGSSTCEYGFQELEVVSPLTKHNKDVFQLCAIALSIMNMLHH